MPNRIVRETILDSDRYHALKTDSERLLFFEILLLADDYGICPANYGFLRRRTIPCSGKTEEQVAGFLNDLQDQDLLRIYVVGGNRYAFIPRFGNCPRNVKPKWPSPPDTLGGNDIKELQEKRIADVKQMRAKAMHLPTFAPETGTGTETETETGTETGTGTGTGTNTKLISSASTLTTEEQSLTSAPLDSKKDEKPKITKAGEITCYLRDLGISTASPRDEIKKWADDDIPLTILGEAVQIAKQRKPNERIPSGYLVGIVNDLLNPKPKKKAWWMNEKETEEMAKEVGCWPARGGESWQEWRNRIKSKIEEIEEE